MFLSSYPAADGLCLHRHRRRLVVAIMANVGETTNHAHGWNSVRLSHKVCQSVRMHFRCNIMAEIRCNIMAEIRNKWMVCHALHYLPGGTDRLLFGMFSIIVGFSLMAEYLSDASKQLASSMTSLAEFLDRISMGGICYRF